MKKIIICNHAMELGGAERALLGLLNSIDYSKYCVDLFLCRNSGELLSQIPKNVNIVKMNQAKYLAVPMLELIKKRKFKILYGRLKAKFIYKRYMKKHNISGENAIELVYSHFYTYKYFDDINPDKIYDLAISFLTPHYIVANKIKARKKIAWIHTDYTALSIDKVIELRMWQLYDYIVSISDKCSESFIKCFPTLKNKIIRIDNIVDSNLICGQSLAFDVNKEMDFSGIKLLSIGRFTFAKNFDSIPEISTYLIKAGLKFRWFLIGFGSDDELIKANIRKYNMQDHVFILGKKDNPYPYLRACDFYIQPSRYEGKAVTVLEAQILKKPVVITNFETANSQLDNGIDGIIVPKQSKECAAAIYRFINDHELLNNIIINLEKIEYGNKIEIEKLYKII